MRMTALLASVNFNQVQGDCTSLGTRIVCTEPLTWSVTSVNHDCTVPKVSAGSYLYHALLPSMAPASQPSASNRLYIISYYYRDRPHDQATFSLWVANL